MLLALLPCQDREDMIAGAIHVTIQKSHSPNDERGQETCPPFCTCTCCSTVRHLAKTTAISIFIQAISSKYPHYRIPSILEQPINFWQPPQTV